MLFYFIDTIIDISLKLNNYSSLPAYQIYEDDWRQVERKLIAVNEVHEGSPKLLQFISSFRHWIRFITSNYSRVISLIQFAMTRYQLKDQTKWIPMQ